MTKNAKFNIFNIDFLQIGMGLILVLLVIWFIKMVFFGAE